MSENKFHLEIPSDPNNLITVEEFVNYFSKVIHINEEKMSGLMLSVTEATTNAIIHANKCDINKTVSIDVTLEDSTLKIVVKDQGSGFDPDKVPDPTMPENLLKDSGRGLYLMKVYMDELRYNVTPEGTETILIMHL